jgi:hypothetical protein
MKLVIVWLVMLMFNIFSGFIALSGIFPTQTLIYQPGYATSATNQLNFTNVSSQATDVQQYGMAAGVIDVIRQGVTFDWLFDYLPYQLNAQPNIQGLRVGLLGLAILINSAAIIQLWLRFSDPFK